MSAEREDKRIARCLGELSPPICGNHRILSRTGEHKRENKTFYAASYLTETLGQSIGNDLRVRLYHHLQQDFTRLLRHQSGRHHPQHPYQRRSDGSEPRLAVHPQYSYRHSDACRLWASERDGDVERSPTARVAHDLDMSAKRLDAIFQPDETGPFARVGASYSIVTDR